MKQGFFVIKQSKLEVPKGLTHNQTAGVHRATKKMARGTRVLTQIESKPMKEIEWNRPTAVSCLGCIGIKNAKCKEWTSKITCGIVYA